MKNAVYATLINKLSSFWGVSWVFYERVGHWARILACNLSDLLNVT